MSDIPVPLAGETLAADTLRRYGTAITSFTPTLEASTTNPTLGSGSSSVGQYSQHGGLIMGRLAISFGTSGVAAGSGTYFLIMPVPILTSGAPVPLSIGGGGITDSSGADDRLVRLYWLTGDDADRVRINGEGFTNAATSSSPWTWAASDQIWASFCYPGDL